MTPLNTLIFGLGLFFLGLKLIGENLHRLSGTAFRRIIKRTTHSPLLTAALGFGAGALMQSATAVTFILVSMSGSGLIKPRAAAPIIIWSNVGLTMLAFVATLNIHPIAAYVVGGAGIVLGLIRIPLWQSLAGALLGIGLILLGLEEMSSGAAPLKDAPWFREAVSYAVSAPPLTFLAGIAVAALLQSNTGAVLLIITFAANQLISFPEAMLLIYGTNLGAIGLRLFLSNGLHDAPLRLVRLEDLFCIFSGGIMVLLYALEQTGVPLVEAAVRRIEGPISTQLATVFLLSNLLPALALWPLQGRFESLLKRFWPNRSTPPEDSAAPLFILPQALDDPPTALDLLSRELAHLLSLVTANPAPSPNEDLPPKNFRKLSDTIEDFAVKLASRSALSSALATRLHVLRAELSIIRHIEEGVRYFSRTLDQQGGNHGVEILREAMNNRLALGVKAAEANDPAAVEELRAKTKLKSEEMKALQAQASSPALSSTALFEDFAIAVWTLHRLAKILARLPD